MQSRICEFIYLLYILIDVEFALEPSRIHVSYGAENCSFSPRAVMFAKTPGNTGEAVRVTSVQFVFVVQIEGY